MKRTPAPCTANGVQGEQLSFLPTPPFSPIWPSHKTIAGRVLAELLRGEWLNHEDVISGCHSWRLAAYIKDLKYKGWPIQAIEIPSPWPTCRTRAIACYGLPPAVIDLVKGMRGEHA